MNDDDLDQLFRHGLQARADEVAPQREYAAAARRGAQRRRQLRAGLASAAVLAVIVPAAVISAQRGDDSNGAPAGRLTNQTATGPTSGGATADATATTGTPPEAVPAGWRVESYGGVQLWVPPDWSWGASPVDVPGEASGPYMCDESREGPYVGRPLMLSDACAGGSLPRPTASRVWFDSPLDVGTADLGGGFTQQTVDIGGMHVTAADSNPDELATIIGSAQAVDTDANGCAADLSDSPPLTRTDQDPLVTLGEAESVSVCVYAQPWQRKGTAGEDAPFTGLKYSTEILGQDAQQVVDALRATPVDHGAQCLVGEVGLDTPVLLIEGSEGSAVFDVSFTPCSTGYFDGHRFRDLTTANVATWDKDGVGTYTYGGNSGFFRGLMG